jgi:NADP-dependent 3-hydroxy acid dehydrogenase YdfG
MTAFAGKVVWMTGAGTGIGKAGALMFAGEGAAVALIGRRRDKLDEVAAEIKAIGGKAAVEALDVADREKVGKAGERLLKRLGRVDILVNNAGLNVVNRRLNDITAEDWDYILAVNLTGAFNMVQAAMPTMRNQKDGLIINIASTAAKRVSGVSLRFKTRKQKAQYFLRRPFQMDLRDRQCRLFWTSVHFVMRG